MMLAVATLLSAIALAETQIQEPPNLIANGSFEEPEAAGAGPRFWAVAGDSEIRQTLTREKGREGKFCARLECSRFEGDSPASHVMAAQVGRVGVERGKWYRLTLWARAESLQAGSVEVSLVNTNGWVNSGLSASFTPSGAWEMFQFVFQAEAEIPAASSRLQFWFRSTGSLWLDDVELRQSTEGPQWFPQIASEGFQNSLLNSSFECGTAAWGSYTHGLSGWAGNLYRLEATQLDDSQSTHGRQSLRIHLDRTSLPVFWFDYYEPIRQPVQRVLAASKGWVRVTPGEPCTLSVDLRAEEEGTVAELAAIEPRERRQMKTVKVGGSWNRHTLTFRPSGPFVFVAVGLDLEASNREDATLWLDAVQLEPGDKASDYRPRQPIESFVVMKDQDAPSTTAEKGASAVLHAWSGGQSNSLEGSLEVVDFFDEKVRRETRRFDLPANRPVSIALEDVARGRQGWFRLSWKPQEDQEHAGESEPGKSVRFAVLPPIDMQGDSFFGFNHAFPWDFLVDKARQAGVVWYRDWSTKWQTVEPEQGKSDFSVPDAQIGRVLARGCRIEALLPFPSASWSTSARAEEVQKAAGENSYLRARLPMAFAPKDLDDFGRFAAASTSHLRRAFPAGVTHVQLLNEPIYTDYALPRAFGYTMEDYVKLVATASRAMKEACPEIQIVGGPSANPASSHTRDFIEAGGLAHIDVLDLHLYDPPRPAENYADSYRSLQDQMKRRGGVKPLWITEWGCYADDDPAVFPPSIGDATMNRCGWPSERAATEHIVKFAAVGLSHGLRKLFFHAGTCGAINGPDSGGVLFEYGGTPRKMLAGVAVFSRLIGAEPEHLATVSRDGLYAVILRNDQRYVAIAWSHAPEPPKLAAVPAAVAVLDIMGNPLKDPAGPLSPTPVYIVADQKEAVLGALPR